MRFKPPNCKRLQGVADARRRARRRPFVLQVPDNKADAVPCERLQKIDDLSESIYWLSLYMDTESIVSMLLSKLKTCDNSDAKR